MDHLPDRPIWEALTSTQQALARGGMLARKYDPMISPFAAAADDSMEALQALGALAPKDGVIVLLQRGPAPVPAGCVAAFTGKGVQMRLREFRPAEAEPSVIALGEADVPDMVALAGLTKPGPFLAGTIKLGGFIGIRIDGRLAAMAGERFKPGRFTEISGVCTHPDFRGQGLAAQLSSDVARRILARGGIPFLHAFADNAAAIRLYEQLGFEIRCEMSVLALRAE